VDERRDIEDWGHDTLRESHISPTARSKAGFQVIEEVDRGEPLVMEEVPFEHPRDDRLEDFEARMHGVEHSLIVKGVGVAIQRLASRGWYVLSRCIGEQRMLLYVKSSTLKQGAEMIRPRRHGIRCAIAVDTLMSRNDETKIGIPFDCSELNVHHLAKVLQ
jgi:hypothetical protein